MVNAFLFLNLRRTLLFILLVGSVAYVYILATVPYVGPTAVKFPMEAELTNALPKSSAVLPQTASKRIAVIIITQMRSGSTFVGEIFNQHPDAFYIFEPLWALENHPNKTYNSPQMQVELLRGVSDCKFEDIKDVMKFYLTTQGLGVMKTCKTVDNMCDQYRDKHQNATWPMRCPIPYTTLPDVLKATCLGKRFTAVKTIRLDNINLLKPLVEQADLDFKIIQLVRDPRAVIASRLVLSKNKVSVMTALHDNVNKQEVRDLCGWMVRNALPYKNKASWLSGRYAMVRYEDVGMEPLLAMSKLYEYIGIPPSSEVSNWLIRNTQRAKRRKDRENPFGTRKDPVTASNEWRTRLTIGQVKTIQSSCKGAMGLFHYQVVKSKQELKNSSFNLYSTRHSLVP